MLNWAKQFSILIFLDSNNYKSLEGNYECLLGAGNHENINSEDEDILTKVQQHYEANKDWVFGHIGYDYKNQLEPKLSSNHTEKIGFPLFHFYVPETVCYINKQNTLSLIHI